MKISSRVITNIGLLIALSIILTRIASIRIAMGGIEGIRCFNQDNTCDFFSDKTER